MGKPAPMANGGIDSFDHLCRNTLLTRNNLLLAQQLYIKINIRV